MRQNSSSALLQVENLGLEFSGFRVLDNINLHVTRGSLHALIGPNGAGKTSLFNCLSGLYRPDVGRVSLDGLSLLSCPPHKSCSLGLVRSFQQPRLFAEFTVMENMHRAALGRGRRYFRFWPEAVDADTRAELTTVLEQVGLIDARDIKANALSHGQQKQLDLALCLAMRPKMLLLDEPTAGMSAAETAETTRLLHHIVQEYALTLLFSEHDMEVVFDLADHITVLQSGRVLASDTPTAIRVHPEVQNAYLGQAYGREGNNAVG